MKQTIIAAYIYAAVVALGGIIGFAAAGSVPSLIAGLIFAILLAISAYSMQKEQPIGTIGTWLLTLFLGCFFLYRFSLSYKFMPAGLMVLVSILFLVLLFIDRQRQKN